LLEKARADSLRHAREEEESKNHPIFLPQSGKGKMNKAKMIAPLDRPMIKFVDVGGKFINKHESLKRIKIASHRRALKMRRRTEIIADERRRIQENLRMRKAAKAKKQKKTMEKQKLQLGSGRSLALL
jgi:ABC-type molybdate transport system ATPase subunit